MFLSKFLISVLLLTVTVFASNKMTFYGCPDECETQKNPSCGKEIDTEYFAALSTKMGKDYCDKYVVVMETKADAKKLVRAKIVDSCSDCPTYHVDLSKKAFTTLTDESVGKSEIIWGIYDRSGSLIKGPYYNSVSKVASSYNLSSSSFISAFKVAARKIASNGSSSGVFSISRESGGNDNENTNKKTTSRKVITTSKKVTSVTTRISTTTVQKVTTTTTNEKKVITTIIYKKPTTSTTKTTAPSPSNTSGNNDNNDNSSKDNSTGSDSSDNITPPVNEHIPDIVDNDKSNDTNNDLPTENTTPSDSPVIINENNTPSESPDIINQQPVSSDPIVDSNNREVPIDNEIYEEEGGNTGATVGVITALTCLGAGGAGLAFMKKKNPNKYEELKKSFPEAFTHVKNGLKRSVTKMRGGHNNNVTLPSHNTYMPTDTIDDDGYPRIPVYDNQPSHQIWKVE